MFNDSYTTDLERISNEIIKLEYLNFIAIKDFFPDMNKLDQLYIYSLLGTTPSNLKYYNAKIDFTENIYNLFFIYKFLSFLIME